MNEPDTKSKNERSLALEAKIAIDTYELEADD